MEPTYSSSLLEMNNFTASSTVGLPYCAKCNAFHTWCFYPNKPACIDVRPPVVAAVRKEDGIELTFGTQVIKISSEQARELESMLFHIRSAK